HVPMQGNSGAISAALLQTKLAGYSTYAVRAEVPGAALQEALFWDTGDPYLYLRIDKTSSGPNASIILGGEDHKTGQETQTAERFRALENKIKMLWPDAQMKERWSGQVIETLD